MMEHRDNTVPSKITSPRGSPSTGQCIHWMYNAEHTDIQICKLVHCGRAAWGLLWHCTFCSAFAVPIRLQCCTAKALQCNLQCPCSAINEPPDIQVLYCNNPLLPLGSVALLEHCSICSAQAVLHSRALLRHCSSVWECLYLYSM